MDCRGISVLVFKSPSFHLIMAPKHKSGDDGNPNKKPKSTSFKRKNESSLRTKEKKNEMLRLLRSMGRKNLP